MLPLRPLSLRECFGLDGAAFTQLHLALRGDRHVPKSRFGLSSLRIYTPRLGLATWAGRRILGRRIPVPNLFNHDQSPPDQGWSVRYTRVRDFRGRGLTYDSHNGTDFAVPPGTLVCAAAPGRVVARRQEFNRGGLKLYVDHGGGLLTTYNHLGRALVSVGDEVGRGQRIALSGYSGLDALATFPWVAPHVHFNVSVGGVLVDPFAGPGGRPLWSAALPVPAPVTATPQMDSVESTSFDPDAVERGLADLHADQVRMRIINESDPLLRAWDLVIEALTYPTRFRTPEAGRLIVPQRAPATTLDLPFLAEDWDGITFADEVGLRNSGS